MTIDYTKLDTRAIPLVQYFNDHGLPTIMSCAGHEPLNTSIFWIQFDDSVSEKDLTNFMMTHRVSFPVREGLQGILGKIGYNFVSNGRFAQRLMVGSVGQPCYSWNYFAASADAADDDLARWLEMDADQEVEK